MKSQILYSLAACAALSVATAQDFQRQAAMTGGGNSDQGRCTIEVVVDDVAQVEIRGATATLHNVSGQPAQWRRFECTGAMPPNPSNFRFQGVDGRGRQTLVRDPRQGGVAVVEIDDKDGGAGGYTFEIIWDSRGNGGNQPNYNPGNPANNSPVYRDNANQPVYRNDPNQPGYRNDPNQAGIRNNPNQPVYRNDTNQPGIRDDRRNEAYAAPGGYRPDYRNSDYYRRYGHGFATDEATRVCQEAVAKQAVRRFGSAEVHFHQTRIDDNPGQNDWIRGNLDVHRGNQRSDMYNFACSVNFDNGRVRSAQLDQRPTHTEW